MKNLPEWMLVIGFFGVLGTTGAMELDDISFTQGLIQYAISLLIVALGFYFIYRTEEEENDL